MRVVVVALALLAACSGGSPVPGGPAPVEDQLAAPHVASEVIVQLMRPDDEEEVLELMEDFHGLSIERIGNTSFYLLRLPAGVDLADVLHELDDDIRVAGSSPNYLGAVPEAEGGPRDLPTLGSDLLEDIPGQPALARLALPAAHALSRGAGIVVAVIDTGVDKVHPLLAGHLAPGGFDFVSGDDDPSEERDLLDNDADGLVDEQYGHGTFVASLVLVAAPDALILPVRALNDEGIGTTASVAAGIAWAVDAGAHVINVSVDIPSAPEAIKEAIHDAEERDVLVVGAAGNSSAVDAVFPARFSQVIGVAAVDGLGVLADFSNIGSSISVVAPGVDLIGAYPLDVSATGTARWSGTSFAAPLVSGSAALVRAHLPALRPDDVKRRLEDTAVSVDDLNPLVAGRLGHGLVQPAAALQGG